MSSAKWRPSCLGLNMLSTEKYTYTLHDVARIMLVDKIIKATPGEIYINDMYTHYILGNG